MEERAGVGHGSCVGEDFLVAFVVAALVFEATQGIHVLWHEADMGHYGDAALSEMFDGFSHLGTAFEFDGFTAGLGHDAGGVAEGLFLGFLVAAERHVDHDAGGFRCVAHGTAVGDHHVESDVERAVHTVEHHA